MVKCQPIRKKRRDSSFLVNTVTEGILIITQEHFPPRLLTLDIDTICFIIFLDFYGVKSLKV